MTEDTMTIVSANILNLVMQGTGDHLINYFLLDVCRFWTKISDDNTDLSVC